jgi:hypothetical protein
MSTHEPEPGPPLAGRYRLVNQTDAGTGWTFWKAIDEILARSVTVLTFAADFPRTDEAITAARAASRVGDPRFSQVFDVEDADGHAYMVMEWVVGESLLDMLAPGPLDAPRAVSLVSEAAQAIATAHAFGLAHLRLSPECLHWTRGSGVKITGLGLAAVLADPPASPVADEAESAEFIDARDLARLLYAALTGYWPGPREPGEPGGPAEATGLPLAPEADGLPLTPRELSPAVPAAIDAIVCQALFERPGGDGQALSSPAMLAQALARVATPDLPPMAAMPGTMSLRPDPPWATAGTAGHSGLTAQYPEVTPAGRASRAAYRRHAERSPAPVILSAVIVLMVAAAGVAGWALSHRGSGNAAAGLSPTHQSSSPSPSAAASVVLRPVGANSFDVYGNDGGNEDASGAKYAIDNSSSTFWHTEYYFNSPKFGNLKPGTGLILDMGEQVRLSQVVVQFGNTCCAQVEIEVGNNNDPVPSTLGTFTQVASSNSASGVTDFNVSSKATGRYVLIWITSLPPLAGSSGRYEAEVYNVLIHGSAVSQSG